MTMIDGEAHRRPYSRKVGERLRAIRRQKRLSLQEVEAQSRAGVQGLGARCLRARRAGHLGASARAAGPVLRGAGRPAAAARGDGPARRPRHSRRRPTRSWRSTSSSSSQLTGAPFEMLVALPADDPGAAPGLQRPGASPSAATTSGRSRRCSTSRSTRSGPRLDALDLLFQSALSRSAGDGALMATWTRSGCTSTSRSARRSATTARSPRGPTAHHLIDAYLARRVAPRSRRAVDAGMPRRTTRLRRRRHADARARRRAGRVLGAIPRRRRRGHRRVQPRRRHRRAAAHVPSPAA